VTNLKICEKHHWVQWVSQCNRVLGDLDFDAGQLGSARANYEAALKNARSISQRDVLIEALLARGRFSAKQGNAAAAQSDLSEALDYATTSGYRIYEADIRIALAWMHRAKGDMIAARAEASRALQMSEEMGYYWGKVDAEEIINEQ
jgi:tetratricopeptide (TPR) repeat protein